MNHNGTRSYQFHIVFIKHAVHAREETSSLYRHSGIRHGNSSRQNHLGTDINKTSRAVHTTSTLSFGSPLMHFMFQSNYNMPIVESRVCFFLRSCIQFEAMSATESN
jgi:hypothetical protein